MKMKKQILIVALFMMAAMLTNAQIKVYTGGSVALGYTSAAPLGGSKFQILGNTVFTSTTGATTSSAFIRGLNAYSSATTPDYTWKGDSTSGLFHTAGGVINFSISGSEKMRLTSAGLGIATTTVTSALSVGGAGNSLYKAYIYNPSTTTGTNAIHAEIGTASVGGYAYANSGYSTPGAGSVTGITGSAYSATSVSGFAYGVYGQAGNGTTGYNYGVFGYLLGSNNGSGIYGTDGTIGASSVPGAYAGYFYGKIRTTNDAPEKPMAGSWTGYSDARLKKDTVAFKDGIEVLRKIKPVSYKFNGIGNLSSSETHIGVIAQQIQPIAPYCVGRGKLEIKQSESSDFANDILSNLPVDSAGVSHSIINAYTFNYDALIYVLINSVKQIDSIGAKSQSHIDSLTKTNAKQDSMINALQQQLTDLTNRINTCCPAPGRSKTTNNSNQNNFDQQDIELSDKNIVVLNQNVPNPFAEQTTISYNIPDNAGFAQIMFYNNLGQMIKAVDIKTKGRGKLNVFANDLSNGIYSYTLIIDGKVIDTKKMLKAE